MKTFFSVKYFILSALFILAPVFSLSAWPEFTLSGGGGVLLGGLFTNYIIDADEYTRFGRVNLEMTQEIQQFNFGGFVFFDATYAEFAVTVQHGINSYKEDVDARVPSKGDTITIREGTGSETMLGFTLLTKYPFQLRDDFIIYPLLGMEYQVALTQKRKGNNLDREYNRTSGKTEFPRDNFTLSLWNSWFVKVGAGMDFYFHHPWYLKTEFLYSFRLITNYEKAAINYLKNDFGISEPKLFGSPGMRGLTHGPELRISVGYRFK